VIRNKNIQDSTSKSIFTEKKAIENIKVEKTENVKAMHISANRLINQLQEVSSSVMLVIEHSLTIANKLQELNEELTIIEIEELENLEFLHKYLAAQWAHIEPSTSEKELSTKHNDANRYKLEKMVHELLSLFTSIEAYRNIPTRSSQYTALEKRNNDPIAYMTLEGERFCILKSTLQELLPNSQLTLRLCSGGWEEQEEKDLDEDGSVYIGNISKELFKKVLNVLRSKKLLNSKDSMKITVKDERQESALKKAFDYLLIDSIESAVEK
jgi:hypothetical protein